MRVSAFIAFGGLSVFFIFALWCMCVVSGRESRREEQMWRFDPRVCSKGICIGDCDKCNRNLPFGEEEVNGSGEETGCN